jgi:Anti-sigma-K factor rskA
VSGSDEDRISYLADGAAGSLSDDDRRELDSLRDALASEASWEAPDSELERAVVAAVAEAAQATPPVGLAPSAERRRRRPAGTHGRRWRAALLPSLGAGVAVAVVVAVLVATLGGSASHGLRFAMLVRGTPLAPRARGSATLTKTTSGWRIELRATGLSHLQNGRYYEAWLKNAAGTLVPVGTFNDARDVTLWSGAPVTVFRRMTVTRQHTGAGPASSGQVVLTGGVH